MGTSGFADDTTMHSNGPDAVPLSPDGWWVSRWVQVVTTCSHLSQDLTVGVHLVPVVEGRDRDLDPI